MQNDLAGWQGDLAQGRRTYFLSHAPSTAPTIIASWVVTEGLQWGTAEADAMMDEAFAAAGPLQCPPLVRYLEFRRRAAHAAWREVLPAVEALRNATLVVGAGTRTRPR